MSKAVVFVGRLEKEVQMPQDDEGFPLEEEGLEKWALQKVGRSGFDRMRFPDWDGERYVGFPLACSSPQWVKPIGVRELGEDFVAASRAFYDLFTKESHLYIAVDRTQD